MAKVIIKKDSPLNQSETFTRLKSVLDQDNDLRKLDPSYVCKFDDQAKTGTAKGTKFEASLKVSATGETSSLEIEVKLPLLLSPFKSMIESTLGKKVEKALA
ncbi:MAG: polyhydroxyalkanoic acid system family protein [Bdellovibrionales bacterium]|nr:polyhydroxyalkanoic acid system family protein [Bdellovibrionales bacterium]